MTARDIATDAFNDLLSAIGEAYRDRGKLASGKTLRGTRVLVRSSSDLSATAELLAPHQWKYVGNGRGPGRRPPIAPIKAWVEARGLNVNAWAVANNIAKFGSFDFRRKRTNIYLDEVKAFEEQKPPGVKERHADLIREKVRNIVNNTK